MRKQLKYGRAAAVVTLILVIPLSILFGCNRTVASMARAVKKAYEQGTEEYGVAYADMKKFANYGENLAAIGEAYGVSGENYENALKTLKTDAATPFSSSTAAEDVYAEASLVYNKLLTETDISEEQKNSAILYFAEMTSARKRLANNKAYNDKAREYNDVLASFPAALLTFGRDSAVIFG